MSQIASRHPGGDYTCALSELHRLLLNYQSAGSFLRQASALTARTVGTGLSCSIMLQSGGHALAGATSDPLATLAEQVQESSGQGPSLRCLRWQHVVQINDLAADTWGPLFALRAAEVGVRSCLCLPLEAPGATGALTLYAPAPHAFGTPQTERASTGEAASRVPASQRQTPRAGPADRGGSQRQATPAPCLRDRPAGSRQAPRAAAGAGRCRNGGHRRTGGSVTLP